MENERRESVVWMRVCTSQIKTQDTLKEGSTRKFKVHRSRLIGKPTDFLQLQQFINYNITFSVFALCFLQSPLKSKVATYVSNLTSITTPTPLFTS